MKAKPRAKEGWVYFVEAEGLARVKIGFSIQLDKRLADLQTASPCKLNLLRRVRATLHVEQALLALFHEFHIHGEWFSLHPTLASFIFSLPDGKPFRLSEIFLAK